ncbi:MAG: O-antigen ligase family protein [Acidobacteriota bacterium]
MKIPPDAADLRGRSPSHIFSITRWGLVAVLLAAPLPFGAVQTWAWAALLIVALALLLLWAIANAQRGILRIHWTTLYLLAALFFILALVQYNGGFTLDRYATRNSIYSLVTSLIFFLLAGQVFREAPTAAWRKLGLVVTLYAFSVGLFAILQFFSGHNLIYWTVKNPGWAFGPYVNHNDYAGLMEMLIPIAAAYVLSRPRADPRRLLLALSLCVPVGSLLLSGSRGGFIALLVEALTLGAILWRQHWGEGSGGFEAMLALGITAVALLFFWMAPNQIVNRLSGLANVTHTAEVTYGRRKLVAIDTLHIFRNHLWIGTGLGSFETVFPQYQTFPAKVVWTHAHNDYAEALAETGAVGGILIVLALVLFFRRAFKDLPERLHDGAGWIRLGAALGCCGLLVHSFADFNLHIPANAAWFAVLAGLAIVPRPRARSRRETR